MKTIIARFQELKTAVGDSVEVDGELVDVNKVDTALKSVGVQLRDSLTGQFRDLDDVFLELASKWDSLDRNTQRYVATIAAGSRQQSRFIAMMDNYERTLELVDIAQNSNGASAAQFAKTLDSLETKMNNIQASFEEFVGTVVGSDLVKGILDSVNTVLQMINDIAEKGPVALGVFSAAFIVIIKKVISNILTSAKTVSSAISAGWQKVTGNYSAAMKKANQDSIQNLEDAIRNGRLAEFLANEIEKGIITGANSGVNQVKSQNTVSSGRSKTKSPVIVQNGQQFDENYRNQIISRLEKKQSISREDRNFLKQNNINLGKNNTELLANLKNYKAVNSEMSGFKKALSSLKTGLSSFAPILSQLTFTISALVTSGIIADAASKGTVALGGATTGSVIGGAVGAGAGALLSLVGVPPQIGMAIGSAIGAPLGGWIGEGIATGLDNAKYGIGSQESIKQAKEEAAKIAEETSKSIEENSNLILLGEEYLDLSEKVNLTVEEKERLIELNDMLINQWDELSYVNSAENDLRVINIDNLKEEIKLKKQLIAQDTAKQSYANYDAELKELSRSNQDARDAALNAVKGSTSDINKDIGTSENGYLVADEVKAVYSRINALLGDEVLTYQKVQTKTSLQGMINTFLIDEIDNIDFDKVYKILNEKGEVVETGTGQEIFNNIYNYMEGSSDRVNEAVKAYQSTLSENMEKIKETASKMDTDITSILDASFFGVSNESFAAKNKSYLSELLKIENLLTPDEMEQLAAGGLSYDYILNKRNELSNKFINDLNSFNEKEKEVFQNALSMIGLFRGENGEVDSSQIINYIRDSLGGVNETLEEEFLKVFSAQGEELFAAWDQLLGDNQAKIQEIANQFGKGGELIAASFAQMTIKTGNKAPAFIEAFSNAYQKFIDKYSKYENGVKIIDPETEDEFNAIRDALSQVDATSANSIAKLRQKLSGITDDEELIAELTDSLGPSFYQSGLTAEEALNDIESNLENVTELLDLFKDSLDGKLSMRGLEQINSKLRELGMEALNASDLVATGEGFKIVSGKAKSVIGETVNSQADYAMFMAEQAAKNAYLKRAMAENTTDEEKKAQYKKEAEGYEDVELYYEGYAADIRAREIKASIEAADAEKERLYDSIQQYKDMIAEMERYYNIQRKILQLQNDQKNFELDFDLATNSKQAGEATRNQILNLVEQQALLKQAGQIYQKDLQELGNYINQDFGQFLTVDESGNIFQNTDELVKLAERMKGASEQESEELQKQWDEIKEVQSAYEDLYNTVNSNVQEYKQNLIEQRKLEQQIKQYQVDLEKTLRDMIIKDMQDEVKAVQDKYNKIKQEDQKYLSSLQKNINKRKQMQSDQDQDKEIETLQNRIGLLSRDTSGIYTKEIEDLQAELDQLLQEKANTALDRLYEEEEAKTQKVSDELTLRSEYLQQQLDYELETYKTSNQKVAELLELKDEEILNWMKQHSEDFRKATTTEQELFITQWTTQIAQGKVAQDELTDNLEKNKTAILNKFTEIKTGGIDVYIKAMKEADAAQIVVKTNTDQLDVAIQKVKLLKSEMQGYSKKETKKNLDDLLTQITNAYAAGNDAEGKKLEEEFKNTLKFYESSSVGGKSSEISGITNSAYYNSKNKKYASDVAREKGIAQKGSGSSGESKKDYQKWIGKTVEITGTGNYKGLDLNGNSKYYEKQWGVNENLIIQEVKEVNGTWYARGIPQSGPNKGVEHWIPIKELRTRDLFGKELSAFAEGGMVDYTGPAWVDGTPSKPEAFLSASDTENIAKLRDILSKVFKPSNSSSDISGQNQNTGDTYYEFHITVDELGDGYDAKDMMADMEKYIIQKSNYRNVINIGKRK